ncbi:unnamed protein product [Staurois parvus]|uniref:Uncharacterized protein n=1 Tax=Staurois parvus TaxID=386267 RepID=A0ABN9B7G6_9NEOB|nr:unnamed protein product [Staurois parvus]
MCGIPGIQRTGTSLWWVIGIEVAPSLSLCPSEKLLHHSLTPHLPLSYTNILIPEGFHSECIIQILSMVTMQIMLQILMILSVIVPHLPDDGERDGVIFLCGIPGIQRTGTSLWWVPVAG